MNLQYIPGDSITIDEIRIEFKQERNYIRSRLGGNYKEDNQLLTLGGEETISQRRDIYTNLNFSENYFFLGYDDQDLFIELEIHYCDSIKVFDFLFDFNFPLSSIAAQLSKYSAITKQMEGEYFFQDLKLVIIDKRQMGDDGNTLGYFYCAFDVSHL
jgi:hypothetical protein